MPLTEGDFSSIHRLVEGIFRRRGEYFVTGKVINRDEARMLVWLAEFGDQPIPIVAFNYTVRYYDELASGVVSQKKAKVTPIVPKIGEIVLVARELGTRRMPRCLGVIMGRDWITGDDEF